MSTLIITVYLIIGIFWAIWGYNSYAEGGVPLGKIRFSILIGVFWIVFLFLIVKEEINQRRS